MWPNNNNFKFFFYDASEQFDLYVFFTGGNIRYFIVVTIFILLLAFFLFRAILSEKMGAFFNFLLSLVKVTVENNVSTSSFNYTAYLPLFNLMFFLILFFNLAGLIPFTYTITSLLVVPFFFSCLNFFFTSFIAIRMYGINFFGGFLPSGTNIFIAPLLILIEIISYLVKVLSLAVRLFANMFAGHVLVKVLLSLAWSLATKAAVLPLAIAAPLSILILAILALELFICCLQAYVFINLASIYLEQVIKFLNH